MRNIKRPSLASLIARLVVFVCAASLCLPALRPLAAAQSTQNPRPKKNNSKLNSNAKRTGLLGRYTSDLTELARENRLQSANPDEQIVNRTMQVLVRSSAPVLTSEMGTPHDPIVEAIAQRLAAGDAPDSLRNKRLLTFDFARMLAEAKPADGFERRLNDLLTEASEDEKIILVISDLHSLVGSGSRLTAAASNALRDRITRGELRIIGATSSAFTQT